MIYPLMPRELTLWVISFKFLHKDHKADDWTKYGISFSSI